MNSRPFILALLAVLSVLLSACGKRVTHHPATPTPPQGRKLRLAVVADSRSGSALAARAGCNRAAADLPNVTLDFQYPDTPDASTQKRVVDDLLARSTDGIAISPVDPDSQSSTLTEAAGRTVLFTQNNDAPNSGRVCFVGTDRHAAGEQMAEAIRELAPEGGRVLVFTGPPDNRPAQERLDGLRQSLAGSKVELLEMAADGPDLARILASHSEAKCLVGLTPQAGPTLLHALHDAQPGPYAKIVCCDAETETLQGIREGIVPASVVEQPFEIGRQTILLMNRALNGERSALPKEGRLLIPCKVLRRESVDAYAAKMQGFPTH